jgi:hypothetical protein
MKTGSNKEVSKFPGLQSASAHVRLNMVGLLRTEERNLMASAQVFRKIVNFDFTNITGRRNLQEGQLPVKSFKIYNGDSHAGSCVILKSYFLSFITHFLRN